MAMILVDSMNHRAIFLRDRSNRCLDLPICDFQNKYRLPAILYF